MFTTAAAIYVAGRYGVSVSGGAAMVLLDLVAWTAFAVVVLAVVGGGVPCA